MKNVINIKRITMIGTIISTAITILLFLIGNVNYIDGIEMDIISLIEMVLLWFIMFTTFTLTVTNIMMYKFKTDNNDYILKKEIKSQIMLETTIMFANSLLILWLILHLSISGWVVGVGMLNIIIVSINTGNLMGLEQLRINKKYA